MRWPGAQVFAAVAGVLSPAAGSAAELGDAVAGKLVFEKCKGCHQVGEGAESRIGPHLNGVFGRKAAGLEGFNYSKSLERAGNSGLEWHADTLSAYVENPRSFASGTRMSFPGLKDPQERANVIAYLRKFSDNPQDIPEADPTAKGTDHSVDPGILAIQGDPEYGAYLSSECTTCHQIEGGDEGIPSIVFWPDEDFIIAMHAYKEKQRPHPVMQMIAGRLSNEEIAALAAYFKNPE
ncbi:c-type cytochrome [Leisingera sp. McT4-56]|uniref:c-type cytochrome n=1 Tax=Leisingera sp. McT4-56 TaxID=2881255 RepID=UPI001CF8AE22|nr:c-type cytochrome [Leisingera sp. McT4-56]MCB4457849.1 c-type cytochrome [Leisingera sp. McT4-56]